MKHLKRILSIGAICALLSCSEEQVTSTPGAPVVPNETSSMNIKFVTQNSTDFTARADSAVVHISGDGIETITKELTVTDSSVEGSIEAVLAGDNRKFTIEIFDSEGVVQYSGSSTIDVEAGVVANLPIHIKRQYYGREGDSIALVELDKYNATPYWDWSTPIDTWNSIRVGVESSEAAGRVTSISMDNDFQPTHIPEEIGNLTEMTGFSISGTFTSLPEEFGKLTKLRYMTIYNSKLSSLPNTLGNLDSLSVVELRGCEFTEVPEVLGELAILGDLSMENNKIEKLTFPTLDRVDTLYLQDNLINEIDGSISNLKKVTQLYLDNNKISSFPNEMGELKTLGVLYCKGNEFTELPAVLAQCEALHNMGFANNNISSVPEEITSQSDLGSLSISGNALSFGTLEKLMLISSLHADPQDTLGEAQSVTSTEAVKIGVSVTGTANLYKWTRDGQFYANGDSIVARESGVYECEITNSKVWVNTIPKRDLVLFHRPIAVTIADETAPVLINSPLLTVTNGETRVRIAPELFEITEAVTEFNQIQMVITQLPTKGQLHRYSNVITEPGIDDLTLGAIADGNLLSYTHFGTGSADSFKFKLIDKAGNSSEEYEFIIDVQ